MPEYDMTHLIRVLPVTTTTLNPHTGKYHTRKDIYIRGVGLIGSLLNDGWGYWQPIPKGHDDPLLGDYGFQNWKKPMWALVRMMTHRTTENVYPVKASDFLRGKLSFDDGNSDPLFMLCLRRAPVDKRAEMQALEKRYNRFCRYMKETRHNWKQIEVTHYADNSTEATEKSSLTGETRRVMLRYPSGDLCF
jgi:hypothetical protein